MTTSKQWLQGARPKTLPAAIAPVILATAFAGQERKWIEFSLALIVALGLQIGVNYANDYSDGVRGTDANRVGPLRLVGSGVASPVAVKRAAYIAIALACLAGVALAARSSWLLMLIGAISVIAAWTYTGGPKPYGYFALGEVSVFIFFGLVATLGTYFSQVGTFSRNVSIAAIAMGLLACALLMVNNLRDLENDAIAGKRTLAVRLGSKRARTLYRGTLTIPFLLTATMSNESALYLLPLLALPLWLNCLIQVGRNSAPALIGLLGRTSRLQLTFALLLSMAAVLAER